MPARFATAFLSLLCTAHLWAGTGDVQIPIISSTGALTPALVTKTPGKVIGWDGSGVLGAITVTSSFPDLTNKPTTLSGYGITDALSATVAASTYQPLIGTGTLALSQLATDPLARGNHTGYQPWSTIDGETLPTTLAGYGITDGITAATAAGTYAPLASPAFTGTPTAPTAAGGTNSTQIATTAFVQSALSGEGVAISNPQIAYVQTNGNDSTGIVGDPSHPFASPQGAWDHSVTIIVLGAGEFGGINQVNSDLMIIGHGHTKSSMGAISLTGSAGTITITGNGRNSVSIDGIYISGANGTDGTLGDPAATVPATDGAPGGDAPPDVIIAGLHCTGDIVIAGGTGGSGGYGGDSAFGTAPNNGGMGATGGAGGALTVRDCLVDGYAVSYAGTGGAGGAGTNCIDGSANGGNGGDSGGAGAPGTVTIVNSIVGGCYAAAANPGSTGAGGTGATNGNAGNSGANGAPGTVIARFATLNDPLGAGENSDFRGTLVNGTFYTD
jgi:hypothetical protein